MKTNNDIESTNGIDDSLQTPISLDQPPTPVIEGLQVTGGEQVLGEAGAQSLLANSPRSYLFNQAY